MLTGTFNGVAKDPWGNVRAGFSAEGTVNRKDFGMHWSKTLDNGGLVVGDEVHIKLDIECIKAKQTPSRRLNRSRLLRRPLGDPEPR